MGDKRPLPDDFLDGEPPTTRRRLEASYPLPPSFFALPGEIRNMIYEDLMRIEVCHIGIDGTFTVPEGLAQTCRQAQNEFGNWYRAEGLKRATSFMAHIDNFKVLDFESGESLKDVLDDLPPADARHLTLHLKLDHFDVDDFRDFSMRCIAVPDFWRTNIEINALIFDCDFRRFPLVPFLRHINNIERQSCWDAATGWNFVRIHSTIQFFTMMREALWKEIIRAAPDLDAEGPRAAYIRHCLTLPQLQKIPGYAQQLSDLTPEMKVWVATGS